MAKTEPTQPTGPPTGEARRHRAPEGPRLALLLVLLTLVGIPAVAYLWGTVNGLMAFDVAWARLALSLPVAAVLGLLLRAVGRAYTRLEAAPVANPPPKGE